jgi:hypothetical protein
MILDGPDVKIVGAIVAVGILFGSALVCQKDGC